MLCLLSANDHTKASMKDANGFDVHSYEETETLSSGNEPAVGEKRAREDDTDDTEQAARLEEGSHNESSSTNVVPSVHSNNFSNGLYIIWLGAIIFAHVNGSLDSDTITIAHGRLLQDVCEYLAFWFTGILD